MLAEKVLRVLKAYNLEALEFEPGSTPSSEAAAKRIGVSVGQIAKSLLFKDKTGAYHLIVCAGDSKVHSGDLKRLVKSSASMATAEETFQVTGFYPGGVCPFGVEGVSLWIDSSLRRFSTVYPAAGNDASGVPITVEKLLEITGGQECSICRIPVDEA